MWQNKLNGILGIWVLFLAFGEFSESMHTLLLVITGIAIIIVAFFGKAIIKPVKEIELSFSEKPQGVGGGKFDPFKQPKPKDPAVHIKPNQLE